MSGEPAYFGAYIGPIGGGSGGSGDDTTDDDTTDDDTTDDDTTDGGDSGGIIEGDIDVSNVSIGASNPSPGTTVSISVSAVNVSTVNWSESFPVTVNGSSVGTVSFTLSAGARGSQSVSATVPDSSTMTASAGGVSDSVSVDQGPTSPVFGVSNVSITEQDLVQGENTTVDVTVTNEGAAGSEPVVVTVNGAPGDQISPQLGAGESTTVRSTVAVPVDASSIQVCASGDPGASQTQACSSTQSVSEAFNALNVETVGGSCSIPGSLAEGESGQFAVDVENRNPKPATATVKWVWTGNGRTIAQTTVSISANGTSTASASASWNDVVQGAQLNTGSEASAGVRAVVSDADRA